MAKYGKWLGGALGWAFGGPVGAALGFFVGMMYDDNSLSSDSTVEGRQGSDYRRYRHNTQQGDFAASLLVLSAAVMKADGRVLKSELDFVKAFYIQNVGESRAEEYIRALRDVLKKDLNIQEVCGQIRYFMEHPNRILLLQYLFGIAQADGAIDTQEIQTLRTIAHSLGISPKDFASIYAMFNGSRSSRSKTRPISDAYQILEIESNAEDAEVKRAYRRMAAKYHPDKNRNVGEEHQKMAEAKFIKVQEAYEQIKEARGMK